MNDPEFKYWLTADKNDKYSCICKCCNKTLKVGKSELQKHCGSLKHQSKVKSWYINQKRITDVIQQSVYKNKVKKANLLLSAFSAEHNATFMLVDHLTDVLKKAFPDSDILKDVQLKRTKCTAIVRNVLEKFEDENAKEELQKVCFCIDYYVLINT